MNPLSNSQLIGLFRSHLNSISTILFPYFIGLFLNLQPLIILTRLPKITSPLVNVNRLSQFLNRWQRFFLYFLFRCLWASAKISTHRLTLSKSFYRLSKIKLPLLLIKVSPVFFEPHPEIHGSVREFPTFWKKSSQKPNLVSDVLKLLLHNLLLDLPSRKPFPQFSFSEGEFPRHG